MKSLLGVCALVVLSSCDWAVQPFDHRGPGDSEAPCAEELQAFRETVFSPVLSVRCVGCHNAGGTARQTRFVLSTSDTDKAMIANFDATRRVARERLGDVPLLLLRPTGRHPDGHTGGELFGTESVSYRALEDFVAMVTTDTCAAPAGLTCDTIRPGPRRLRRLSHREYENTMRDLLGATVSTTAFVRDQSSNGFDNDGDTLTVTGTLGDQYLATAETIARGAMTMPSRLHTCATNTSPNATCITSIVRDFGARAFRRPLTEAEVDRYEDLHTRLVQIDAATALEDLVTAMLMSPNFLYRRELGSGTGAFATLDAYEVATELSYTITGTMPDATLRAKAANGTLLEDAVLDAETRRLLDTPAARATLVRMVMLWLSLDRLPSVPKDTATYPTVTDPLRASMRTETELFVEHVLYDGAGTLPELLSAPYSYTDPALRAHYGVTTSAPADARGFSRTDLTSTDRRGVLTHASVLTVHARPNDSSPVHRGKLVRERLLCQPLPPPPPGIVAMPPVLDPRLTTRERYDAHASVEPCASCHRMMDPIGFGLDAFDGIGRAQTSPVETYGAIYEAGSTSGEFDDVGALLERLANSDEVFDCFAREWFRFAYGLVETAELECMLRDVQSTFRASGGSIEDLLVALVLAPQLRSRTTGLVDDGGSGSDGGMPMVDAGTPPMMDASTPPPASLEVTVTVSDRWATGYCANVVLHNAGTSSITWNAPIVIESGYHLNSHWSSVNLGTSGQVVTFGGVAWNASLSAGADTNFGFCTER